MNKEELNLLFKQLFLNLNSIQRKMLNVENLIVSIKREVKFENFVKEIKDTVTIMKKYDEEGIIFHKDSIGSILEQNNITNYSQVICYLVESGKVIDVKGDLYLFDSKNLKGDE